ncbi:MAG: hypothetical protein Q9161_004708 [Pseudevernia consocians]
MDSQDSQSACQLPDQGRAFSTVLTAFVGSIVNGATNGCLVAFMTGWISWLAVLRVLSGALIGLYQAFSSSYAKLEQEQVSTSRPADEIAMEERGLIPETSQGVAHGESKDGTKAWLSGIQRPQHSSIKTMNKRLRQEVTVFGWIGWLYTAVYSPIVQVLWLAENWTAASGPLKIVRAFAISIAALSLTIDTKKRYAIKLRETKYLGSPACVAFKIINGVSAFGMGIMCAALLIKGAIDTSLEWYIIVVYCIFSVIWAAASFSICPVQDGGIKGFGLIGDVLMGAFAGIFLAAPAFAVMQTAESPTLSAGGFSTPESGPASLQSYLSCDSVAVWQKFVAIFP